MESALCCFVPVICFDKDSNILPGRFTMVAVVFGILCVVSYLLLCNLTVERVRQTNVSKEPFNYGKVLKAAFKNRPLIGVMIATVGRCLYHRLQPVKELHLQRVLSGYQLYDSCKPGFSACYADLLHSGAKNRSKIWRKNCNRGMSTYNLLLSSFILFFPDRKSWFTRF